MKRNRKVSLKKKSIIRQAAELNRQKPVIQKCYVANPKNLAEGQEIEFLVDTGSNCLVIPASLAKKLRLISVGRGESQLADGTVIQSDMAWIYIRLNGESVHTLTVIIDKAEPILGLDVMRILQLQVDPANDRLLKPIRRLSLIKIRFKKGVFPWKTLFGKH